MLQQPVFPITKIKRHTLEKTVAEEKTEGNTQLTKDLSVTLLKQRRANNPHIAPEAEPRLTHDWDTEFTSIERGVSFQGCSIKRGLSLKAMSSPSVWVCEQGLDELLMKML